MTLLLIFILGLTLVQLGRLYFERQGARELSITLLSDVSRLEPGADPDADGDFRK